MKETKQSLLSWHMSHYLAWGGGKGGLGWQLAGRGTPYSPPTPHLLPSQPPLAPSLSLSLASWDTAADLGQGQS